MEWHMDGIQMGYGVTNQVRKTLHETRSILGAGNRMFIHET